AALPRPARRGGWPHRPVRHRCVQPVAVGASCDRGVRLPDQQRHRGHAPGGPARLRREPSAREHPADPAGVQERDQPPHRAQRPELIEPAARRSLSSSTRKPGPVPGFRFLAAGGHATDAECLRQGDRGAYTSAVARPGGLPVHQQESPMQRLIAAAALMSLSSLALAEPSIDCSGLSAPQVIQSATAVAPVAGELGTPEQPLGVAGGVLDQPATDALSAEQVLYRQQLERCAQVATATAPAVPGVVPAADAMPAAPVAEGMVASTMPAATPAPEVIDAATYKPRTEFDNTPWRFNMNQ